MKAERYVSESARALDAWLTREGWGSRRRLAEALGVKEALVGAWREGRSAPGATDRAALQEISEGEVRADGWDPPPVLAEVRRKVAAWREGD